MILSYTHRFLFIKTKKTAGTSVEIVLSQFCGEADIITPISPEDELVRYQEAGAVAQNYCHDATLEAQYAAATRALDLSALLRLDPLVRESARFYNHVSYCEIEEQLGQDALQPLTVFTVERSPDERFISFINYRRKGRKPLGRLALFFMVFLVAPRRSFRNAWLYTRDGQSILDLVVAYDDLESGLGRVLESLGISGEFTIPKTKVANSKTKMAQGQLTWLEHHWIEAFTSAEYAELRRATR
jgi:hypothetical protein